MFSFLLIYRFLNNLCLQEGMAYDLIVGTTKIVSGHTLAETFVEKLGWGVRFFFICPFACLFVFFVKSIGNESDDVLGSNGSRSSFDYKKKKKVAVHSPLVWLWCQSLLPENWKWEYSITEQNCEWKYSTLSIFCYCYKHRRHQHVLIDFSFYIHWNLPNNPKQHLEWGISGFQQSKPIKILQPHNHQNQIKQ